MTENSASLGVPPRAGPPRNTSTSHGGVSTTFPSCQSLAMGAVSAAIRLSSGECRIKPRESFNCVPKKEITRLWTLICAYPVGADTH